MKCKHQFIKMRDANQYAMRERLEELIVGVEVMCALCGEYRRLNYDGEIDRFDEKADMWVVFKTRKPVKLDH